VEPAVGEWLIARCNGGFFATPAAPMPDLALQQMRLHAARSSPESPMPTPDAPHDSIISAAS